MQFTTLWHHVYNVDRLRGAYLGLKRNAAPGVDRVTWRAYGEDLEANLLDLSDRLKRARRGVAEDKLREEWKIERRNALVKACAVDRVAEHLARTRVICEENAKRTARRWLAAPTVTIAIRS